jgi:hypothetical protein
MEEQLNEFSQDLYLNSVKKQEKLKEIFVKLSDTENKLYRSVLIEFIHNKTIVISESAKEARLLNKENNQKGKVRVGKIAGRFDKGIRYPVTEGYINIVVCSINKTKIGSQLTPFTLTDNNYKIMENIWQFSKVYKTINSHTIHNKSRVTWNWPASEHISQDTDLLTPAYWKWRKAGMNHPDPIRSPVPTMDRRKCLYCAWPSNFLGEKLTLESLENIDSPFDEITQLPYVSARIKVYCPLYMCLAKIQSDFFILQKMIEDGYNIQILDIDGPIRDDFPPYNNNMIAGQYGEDGVGSIPLSREIIRDLINNVMQPFGHGFVLAVALLGEDSWIHSVFNYID